MSARIDSILCCSPTIDRCRSGVCGISDSASISFRRMAIGSSNSSVSGGILLLLSLAALTGQVTTSKTRSHHLPQGHRAGATDLRDLRDQSLRRPDTDLRVDVNLHPQPAIRVLQLDVER